MPARQCDNVRPMLIAGTRLGPYEVVGPLGAGGMGEVYKGLDTRVDRAVAIKVLPPTPSSIRRPVSVSSGRHERSRR